MGSRTAVPKAQRAQEKRGPSLTWEPCPGLHLPVLSGQMDGNLMLLEHCLLTPRFVKKMMIVKSPPEISLLPCTFFFLIEVKVT